jgi:hypothetical protein
MDIDGRTPHSPTASTATCEDVVEEPVDLAPETEDWSQAKGSFVRHDILRVQIASLSRSPAPATVFMSGVQQEKIPEEPCQTGRNGRNEPILERAKQ